jgi:hypothetical protein
LAWPPAPTPAPTARAATASSSWPTAARCSWTKSATCRRPAGQAAARAAGGRDRAAGLQQAGAVRCALIAATSRDLATGARGQFREDLYYRLNVLPIRVPPLRERRSDIPALVEVLGEDMALRSGSAAARAEPEALALLAGQPWRGNIRELRNVLEQAAMRSDSQHHRRRCWKKVLRESGVEADLPLRRSARCGGHWHSAAAGPQALLAPAGRAGGRTGAAGHRGRHGKPPAATRWRPPNCWAFRAPSCTNGWKTLSENQTCLNSGHFNCLIFRHWVNREEKFACKSMAYDAGTAVQQWCEIFAFTTKETSMHRRPGLHWPPAATAWPPPPCRPRAKTSRLP